MESQKLHHHMGSIVKAKERLPNYKKESRLGKKILVFKEDEIDEITDILDSAWIRHQENSFRLSGQRFPSAGALEKIPPKLDHVTVDPTCTKN